jgi:hypothetical protein
MTDTVVRFPRESDSPLEAANQIRAIVNAAFRHRPNTGDEFFRTLRDMHHLYWLLVKASGREVEILAAEAAEKEAERRAIRDFVACHVGSTQEPDSTDPALFVVDRATPSPRCASASAGNGFIGANP